MYTQEYVDGVLRHRVGELKKYIRHYSKELDLIKVIADKDIEDWNDSDARGFQTYLDLLKGDLN